MKNEFQETKSSFFFNTFSPALEGSPTLKFLQSTHSFFIVAQRTQLSPLPFHHNQLLPMNPSFDMGMSTKSTSIMASPTTQTPPLTEFHPFPRLPVEARYMIWSCAFPRRVIDIFAHRVETWTDDELDFIPNRLELDIDPEPGEKIHMERIFARLYPTPLSSVNTEARNFLPSGYRCHISTDLTLPEDYVRVKHPNIPGSYDCPSVKPTQTHFLVDQQNATNFTKTNFEQDVLFLRPLGSQQPNPPIRDRSLGMSQTLEVFLGWASKEFRQSVRHLAINHLESLAWTTYSNSDPLLSFPNLETLWVVYDEHREVELESPINPTKILRGRERTEKMKDRARCWLGDWGDRCDGLAEKHAEWNCPDIRMVKNTKTLRRAL